MKHLVTTVLLLMALCLVADARPRGAAATGPVNMGGGPNLVQRSLFSTNTPNLSYSEYYNAGVGSPAVSTSDYLNMNGVWRGSQPFDLDAMGSDGAAVKAANGGNRYVWMMSPDHPNNTNFVGSGDLYVGFSNDPQIWPETVRKLLTQGTSISVVDEFGTTQNFFFPYQFQYLVYNPDSAGDKFWIYAEASANGFQHELALLTTPDFLTATIVGPVIATQNFSGTTSLGYVNRIGTGNWEAFSWSTRTNTFVNYVKYTSTDGLLWTAGATVAGPGQYTTISGQKYLLEKEPTSVNDYISLLAVNSSNVSLGTFTRISTAFGPSASSTNTVYPGPTYLQDVWGYEEDGILSIYASRGFFPDTAAYHLNSGPYLGISPTYFNVTAQITGCPGACILDVSSVAPGSVLAVGQQLDNLPSQPKITSFGTGTGGAGTYNISGTNNLASGTIQMVANGGLWHTFIDQYSLVTDSTTAASAAPLGVKASCAAGTATAKWNNVLPHQNYRVYYGSSAGTQSTLVGDVTGTSVSFTPPANQQTWIKVVTMNVTEQKSRVVNVYCSSQTAQVNKHVNRVLNDGGTFNNLSSDITFIATADSWLTSNNTYRYLNWWTDVRFGYKLDGSGFIAKIYDFGTTYLPRGGDYTPTTSNTFPSTSSNTSYSSNAFRGTTPSWVNNAASAHGYFGNGRPNNIQRWNKITLLGAYQRPSGTGVAALFGNGEAVGFYLRQESGTSGNITFGLSPDWVTTYTTATVPFSGATTARVIAGKFDGTNGTAYLDGVPGTPVDMSASNNPSMLKDTILRGRFTTTSSVAPVLASGATSTRQNMFLNTYNMGNDALFTAAGLGVFSSDLSDTQIQSWSALYN